MHQLLRSCRVGGSLAHYDRAALDLPHVCRARGMGQPVFFAMMHKPS